MPPPLLVSSLADAAVAGAQAERRIRVFVRGGLAVPNSPAAFRDGWKEGFDLVAGAGFPLTSKLTLQESTAHWTVRGGIRFSL
jgi:hypothetical protein